MDQLFGAMGGGGGKSMDKKCKMKCGKIDNETTIPAIKDKYHFNSNGCGYQGMDIGGSFDFSPCCDLHDVCYTICGAKHSFCEKKFGECQSNICQTFEEFEDKQECESQRGLYQLGTGLFGCGVFPECQEEACDCVKKGEYRGVMRKWLNHFQEEFVPEGEQIDIDGILKPKKRAKIAEKIYDLFEKYRHAIRLDYDPAEKARNAIETRKASKEAKAKRREKQVSEEFKEKMDEIKPREKDCVYSLVNGAAKCNGASYSKADAGLNSVQECAELYGDTLQDSGFFSAREQTHGQFKCNLAEDDCSVHASSEKWKIYKYECTPAKLPEKKGKEDVTESPRKCCKAIKLSCLACDAGLTEEEFCERTPAHKVCAPKPTLKSESETESTNAQAEKSEL